MLPVQTFALDSAVVEVQEMFSSHGGLLRYKSPTKKGVILYFCPYFNQAIPKSVLFSIAVLTSVLLKSVFSLFFLYSNQSPIKKGVFPSSIFALILNKALA